MSFSVNIPTIGRPDLARTIDSIRRQSMLPGDEVIVVGDGPQEVAQKMVNALGPPFRYLERGPPPERMGGECRNIAMEASRGDYLLFMDDDDEFADGAFDLIRAAIVNHGSDAFFVFKMRFGDQTELWANPTWCYGNIGTPMMVVPNLPSRLGRWKEARPFDWGFACDTIRFWPEGPVWIDGVIALIRPTIPWRVS